MFRPIGYSSVERRHLHVRCIDFVVSQCFWFLAVDATVFLEKGELRPEVLIEPELRDGEVVMLVSSENIVLW